MEVTEHKQRVKKVKESITKKRIEITEEKSTAMPMGEETVAILPEDMTVMYSGKLCANLIKANVGSQNILKGYMRMYPEMDEYTKNQLTELQKDFAKDFELAKTRTNKIASKHPLYIALQGIKGISAYQIALIMSYMKHPGRFDTPSKLCVYAGVACINGMPVIKANINKISDWKTEQGIGEFAGFNTEFSGRMNVIMDCLIRAKGFFYEYYLGIRKRLEQRAVNGQECFRATPEDVKASKGIMKLGEYYMNAPKKNQSLIMWAHKNACRRIARTFLHLLWTEWRKLAGLPNRMPYAIDYLAHSGYISLEQVIKADSVKRKNKKKDAAPETPEANDLSEDMPSIPE